MRVMTSEPVPWPKSTGNKPAMMTATVMALGRTRWTAPSRMAASSVCSLSAAPAARRC
jgi:hypothetical protein